MGRGGKGAQACACSRASAGDWGCPAFPTGRPGGSAPACARLSLDAVLPEWQMQQLSASQGGGGPPCAPGSVWATLVLLKRGGSRWPPASVSPAPWHSHREDEGAGHGEGDQCRGHTARRDGPPICLTSAQMSHHLRRLPRHLPTACPHADVTTPRPQACAGQCHSQGRTPGGALIPGPARPTQAPLTFARILSQVLPTEGPGVPPWSRPGPGPIPGLQVWVPVVACARGDRSTSLPHVTASLCVSPPSLLL